jgi:hypothetical protein
MSDLTPLQRLTALYTNGGYGLKSAQYAADLLSEHDAGKATRKGEATLSSAVLELLTAIVEALDVPLPGLDEADDRAYQAVMRRRLSEVHIVLDVALSPEWVGTLDPAREAANIRQRTADTPITYTVWERPADGGEQS